jgi:hypothetical protein
LGFFTVFLILITRGASGPLFKKLGSFHSDDHHSGYFQKFDSNRDGILSRSEFLSSIQANEDVFDYLIARRNLELRSKNISIDVDGLTYTDFMWFYRESSLFEKRNMVPPPPPENLYSFPSWPGVRYSEISEGTPDMTPKKFWSDYVLQHKAVVIRNGLNGSRALSTWSDPEYLVSHFGDLKAKIEHRHESRGDHFAGKVVRSGRSTISDIVEKKVDGYVVSVVPQPMAWDISIPSCVLCGSRERKYLDISSEFKYVTEIEETSLWISRGKTRSQFHYDKENTFNCLVTGEPKKWVIMDTRKYGHIVPWVRTGGYDTTDDMKNNYTDWVGINVDSFDINLHNYLLEAEFEILTQYPGDCVFLPYSMLHYAGHLVPDDTLQVAVSFMWLPETLFNENDCPSEGILPFPLAVFDSVWYYSGFGAVPQGHHNPRHLAEAITPQTTNGTYLYNKLAIANFITPGDRPDDFSIREIVNYMTLIKQFVHKQISVPLDLWLQLSTAVDMNGLGCNRNQSYIPRPLEEMNKMFSFFNGNVST